MVRIRKDGNYGYSKPCWHCIQEMKKAGIYRVFYSLDSPPGELWYNIEKISEITGKLSSGNRVNPFDR